MSKPSCSNMPNKQKYKNKYQNVVSKVYTNVINDLIEPLQEEFIAAGCDASTLQTLCNTWYDKIKTTNAVESLSASELRKYGALSASERAKAIAKRDMEVAYERMSCTNVQLVGNGPTTSPVITAQGNIVQRQNSNSGDQHNNDSEIRTAVGKAEWHYPPEALNAEPDSLVLYTLNVPMQTTPNSAVQMRKFNVRLPASLAQKGKLDTLIDQQLLEHLTNMSMPTADIFAILQGHIQTKLNPQKHNSKRMRLAQQLDGSFSDSDDGMDFSNSFDLKQMSDEMVSCSDETLSSSTNTHLPNMEPKRLSSKSKLYLRRLFHLCGSSSSSEENSENELRDLQTVKKMKINRKKLTAKDFKKKPESLDTNNDFQYDGDSEDQFTANKTIIIKSQGHDDDIPMAYNKKSTTAKLFVDAKPEKCLEKPKEIVKDDTQRTETDEILNSEDELSSLESNEETENVCICLFDKVKRRKSKWRMQLRSGIMNLNGGDYVFDSMDVQTVW